MKMLNIAIALSSVDQVERVPADLIDSAEPGTSVDLLIRTKPRRAIWMQAQLTALSTHHSTAVKICDQQWRFEVESEHKLAERSCAPLRAALAAKNVDLRIHIYAGAFKKSLKHLMAIRGAPFFVVCVRKDCRLLKTLRVGLTSLGFSKPAQSAEISLAYRHNV
jgi:hypothetical protein